MRENSIVVPVATLRRILIMLAVLVALVLLILVMRTQLFRAGISTLFSPSAAQVIDSNAYQAVFLVGGQVFFGKLQEQGSDYFILTDVFYLSVPDQAGAQGQLVKRGNELHGPKDPMIIPASDVLFIENMREDSTVASAIRQFKAGTLPIVSPAPITAAPTGTPRPTGTAAPSPTR